jgi:anti-sigma regulatory factor (Ser/Thr protein kinase)
VIHGGRAALDQVRQSRMAAAAHVRERGLDHLVHDVELLTTELVTNAVLHGGGLDRLHLQALPAGIRVEVSDRSNHGPLPGVVPDDAGTGRGLLLVAQIASRWGVERGPEGKTVWAEVTGVAGTGRPEVTEHAGRRTQERRCRVVLGAVPTDLLVAAKAHVDTLIRELTLISVGAEPLANGLGELIDVIASQFAGGRQVMKEQAARALQAGEPQTELVLDLLLDAADEAKKYLAAMERLDGLCRAQRLTTLATPPSHAHFRRWYLQETIRQLRAAAAGSPRPPLRPFEAYRTGGREHVLPAVDPRAGACFHSRP